MPSKLKMPCPNDQEMAETQIPPMFWKRGQQNDRRSRVVHPAALYVQYGTTTILFFLDARPEIEPLPGHTAGG